MHLRYATPLLILAFFATVLAAPPTASAQIELDEQGNVGIGTDPNGWKLFVEGGIRGVGNDGYNIYGVDGAAYGNISDPHNSYGIYGYSSGGTYSYGVYARSVGGSSVNYGIRASTSTYDNGASAYGVYAYANSNSGQEYAGYFSGDVHITGNLTEVSDRKFKREIRSLGSGLSGVVAERIRTNAQSRIISAAANGSGPIRSAAHTKLLQLRPKKYRYRREEYKQMGFPKGDQFGLVAQEVEEVFPELVSTEVHPGVEKFNDKGKVISIGKPITYKSVNYVQLIPIMIQTIREQQAEIDLLRERVRNLERGQ